ncbi:unnamed protein product [Microthlaspi erraticum]|uniref:TIR domain-containing protein n=1 Tax=Microthlaspi erraticum TaxID=1685480 RepID=A0A6D2KKY6_9BRAS|nr:unnamed protein product [Microthlaspi erraticum]
MASSLSSRTWRYDVYASFYGKDVRRTLLSNLRKHLKDYAITMFDDREIDRSQTIAHALTQGIRESSISIVVLSKNYASSTMCLDELLEILKCMEDFGQIVMPIFYGVDPYDVRKQTGEFGIAFNKTCRRKTEEDIQIWSKALTDVTNLGGYISRNWDNEAEMVEEIARDVLGMLNATPSKYFDGMVGLEAHLNKIHSLLHLDDVVEAMIVGIFGHAGIGKSTIARALHSRLSRRFQLTCFMDNVGQIFYDSDLDGYRLKLKLQEELKSKILNHDGMRIDHLPGNLRDKKVLIVLDDVDELLQVEALADEITSWFCPGSRIIVTTKDKELLRQHGIDNKYRVDLPSNEQALEILCGYAFGQSSPHDGFRELALRVTKFCVNLPLRLREVGTSLRGKNKEEWKKLLGDRNEPRSKSKNRCSTGMKFLVVINLLIEITAAVSEQLSSVRKPYFARISLAMSVLSIILFLFELGHKIQASKARFQWKWMPIPWFYHPSGGYKKILGSSTDAILFFCGLGQLAVSISTCIFIEGGKEGPINVAVFPLFFAIGMVISKFMEKPAAVSEETLPLTIKTQ